MAERTKAQQVDQAGYTRRDLATLQKKRVGGCARCRRSNPCSKVLRLVAVRAFWKNGDQMTNDVEKQGQLTAWVQDVNVTLDKLNDLLAKAPAGIDVNVTVGKSLRTFDGTLSGMDDSDYFSKIIVSATRTEKLI
ncbi:hypothetical protein Q3A80_23435 [Burkholderia sp. SR8]|uniref:hypothetical protein n=1 Tax=Burkholderia sp. SR8 TaxID=3062277 RepID=UPI004064652C